MGRVRGRRGKWGLCLALVMIAGGVARAGAVRPGQASERPAAADLYERMTGEVTIRHGRIDARGVSVRSLVPTSVLQLERQRHTGRWRTTLTVRAEAPVVVQSLTGRATLDNPFAVTRFEYDEDGPPRMYNRAGALIAPPGPAARRALGLPEALRDPDWRDSVLTRVRPSTGPLAGHGPGDGLVMRVGDRAARRASLERAFGLRTNQVRGLDRFVQQDGQLVKELLADPHTALPVEINSARSGRLLSHSTFVFEPLGNGEVVRRLLRSERASSETDDGRIVMEIELSNVSFTKGNER